MNSTRPDEKPSITSRVEDSSCLDDEFVCERSVALLACGPNIFGSNKVGSIGIGIGADADWVRLAGDVCEGA